LLKIFSNTRGYASISEVVLHLRLGDYYQNQDVLNILPLNYYLNILNFLRPSRVFVICENTTQAIEYLSPVIGNYNFVTLASNENDLFTDFYKLASFKFIISSNSSFSVCASLISSLYGGQVFFPGNLLWHTSKVGEVLNKNHFEKIPGFLRISTVD
jgi:hypothetical protein